ncbi:MAG: septum formation protein Maf [Glaciimonas sp.]|nr:septum formation protein Maf [Glaciimonas sp.]
MKNLPQKICLASKSPRRRELLRQIGIDFELLLLLDKAPRRPDVDEKMRKNEQLAEYVARVVTREKAAFACKARHWRRILTYPIMTADTKVNIEGTILGKPADITEVVDMLQQLSGCTHLILTNVVVMHLEQFWQITQSSEVVFQTLSDETIRAYCATSEPYDKAGAYGIQGPAAIFIKRINGIHSGIMSLPLFKATQILQKAGIRIL